MPHLMFRTRQISAHLQASSRSCFQHWWAPGGHRAEWSLLCCLRPGSVVQRPAGRSEVVLRDHHLERINNSEQCYPLSLVKTQLTWTRLRSYQPIGTGFKSPTRFGGVVSQCDMPAWLPVLVHPPKMVRPIRTF